MREFNSYHEKITHHVPWPRKKPKEVFIRFGWYDARSWNHATHEIEFGVSVCPARLNEDLTVALLVERCHPTLWEQLKGQGRLVLVLTGSFIGYGSDGEPLIRGVRELPYAIDRLSIPNLR